MNTKAVQTAQRIDFAVASTVNKTGSQSSLIYVKNVRQ